jgi:hypothetical protein
MGSNLNYHLEMLFLNYLNENLSTEGKRIPGFNPLKFLNLIICDKYSLVKVNGMLFYFPLTAKG